MIATQTHILGHKSSFRIMVCDRVDGIVEISVFESIEEAKKFLSITVANENTEILYMSDNRLNDFHLLLLANQGGLEG